MAFFRAITTAPSPMPKPLGALALATALCIAGGCASSPHARPAGSGPAEVLSISATDFVDTDGNGYRDSGRVVLYVFSSQSAIPLRARGDVEITLEDRNARTIAQWRYPAREAESFRADLPPGPGYVFTLSLADRAGDRIEHAEAEVQCRFWPEGSQTPLTARTSAPVLLGPMARPRAQP